MSVLMRSIQAGLSRVESRANMANIIPLTEMRPAAHFDDHKELVYVRSGVSETGFLRNSSPLQILLSPLHRPET